MNEHLTDELFTEAAAGIVRVAAREHLTRCAECKAELERLKETIAGLKEASRTVPRTESDWWAQRARLHAMMREDETGARPGLGWAAAVVFIVLAGSMLIPRLFVKPYVAVVDPDQKLLIDI